MPDNGKKSKKPIIISIIIVLILAAAAGVAAFFLLKNKPLDSSYFVSDDTKLVYNVSKNLDGATSYDSYEIYMVYFYEGDKLTGLTTYYGYESEDAAKAALEKYSEAFKTGDDITKVEQNGKYICLTAAAYLYEGTTVDSIRTIIEFQEKGNTGIVEEDQELEQNIIEDAEVKINWD